MLALVFCPCPLLLENTSKSRDDGFFFPSKTIFLALKRLLSWLRTWVCFKAGTLVIIPSRYYPIQTTESKKKIQTRLHLQSRFSRWKTISHLKSIIYRLLFSTISYHWKFVLTSNRCDKIEIDQPTRTIFTVFSNI